MGLGVSIRFLVLGVGIAAFGTTFSGTGTPNSCGHAMSVKWSCAGGACVGQNGVPRCDSQADCDRTPYVKYCALDPNYERTAWVPTTLADPACGTNGAPCPNTCNTGTSGNFGPAVTYTCDVGTHQCLSSSGLCMGEQRGAGSVCNNECRAGVCASDYGSCEP